MRAGARSAARTSPRPTCQRRAAQSARGRRSPSATPCFVVAHGRRRVRVDVDGVVLDSACPARAGHRRAAAVSTISAPSSARTSRSAAGSMRSTSRRCSSCWRVTPATLGSQRDRAGADRRRRRTASCSRAEPDGWRAIFGHYTPTLRPADIIDQQVAVPALACSARARTSSTTIYLAPHDDRCGTYLPRTTPDAQRDPLPREWQATTAVRRRRDAVALRAAGAVGAPAEEKHNRGTRSGPRRARRRHEQGRGAHRRGDARRRA